MSARSSMCGVSRTVLATLGLIVSGSAVAQSSPSDFTAATRYDLQRRVVGTIAPDPDGSGPIHYAATRNTYDAAGNLVRVETGELASWQSEAVAPAAWSGFTVFRQVDTSFDVMDRKMLEVISSGGTAYAATQYSYDVVGRLECTAVRMNPAVYGALPSSACALGTAGAQGPDRITRTVYDPAGQVLTVQKAYGTPLQQDYASYAYSDNGKPTRMIDANGNQASMSYDGFDRQVKWNFPSTTTPGAVNASDYEAYTYDANGNRLSLRKRDGQVLSYGYDALNRMISKGGAAAAVSYGYDLHGLQTSALFGASGLGVTSGYDGFGRLVSSSSTMDGTARTFTYQYDADGNRTRIMHPDGIHFDATYDGLDRELGYYQGGGAIAGVAYDAQGRRSSDGRWAVSSYYGYDAVSRLQSLNHTVAGYNVTWMLGYNPASQIVTQARDNDAYAYGGYASASTSYAVNGLNQYASVGGAAFGYDANGNLTSDGVTSYGYDAENRLVSASSGATLDYDPLGRLWRVSASGTTTELFYDGDRLVEERDGSGTLLRRYVHGTSEDTPYIWYEGAGLTDPRSLQTDHQGSIVSVANASGAAIAIDSYDEYGVPGAGNVGRFQYTGQGWLPALGLYYYKARMYAPRLGRFLQTDPIGYADQNNLYTYVGNDPANATDPSGNELSTTNGSICSTGDNCEINGVDHDLNPAANDSKVDHAFRDGMTAGGAVLGAALGGGIGGAAGGSAGVACGPAVEVCAPAGAIAGTTVGTAVGAAGGAAAGHVIGDAIDKGVAAAGKWISAMTSNNKSGGGGYKSSTSGSGKEKATDIPSWVRQKGSNRPLLDETPRETATRIMNDRYGDGNWSRSSGEFSKIQKWAARSFK